MKRKIRVNRQLRVTLIEHAEMQAGYLVGFLNTVNDRPEHAEVLKILDLCKELEELRKTAPRRPLPAEPTSEVASYLSRMPIAMSALNKMLQKFQFVPALIGLAFGDDPFRVDWSPAHVQFLAPAEVKRIMMAGATPIPPLSAVKLVLEMTETGTLDRIRKCICGLWFFAGNNKKYSCSDACKFKKHTQRAAFKSGRADYMKGWRKNRKAKMLRERRAKARQAGRKTP
jgi:hypothetical protein